MERGAALGLLPLAYGVALCIADLGADHAMIARALEVPVESVPRLLEIGAAKLAALLLADGHPTAD